MRCLYLTPALLFGALATGAQAMPVTAIPVGPGTTQVQMVCTPQSCIDQRTGVYTSSTCNRRGCWPSSGPVGRLPGYGGGHRYGGGPAYSPGYGGGRYRGGGNFEPLIIPW
jgi:hypothetical protein